MLPPGLAWPGLARCGGELPPQPSLPLTAMKWRPVVERAPGVCLLTLPPARPGPARPDAAVSGLPNPASH